MTLTLLSMKYLQMKKRLTDTMPASIGEMNQDNTTNVKKKSQCYTSKFEE